MVDDITEAVLSREDIARYLRSGDGGRAARERVHAYLEELRTTQRYSIYRALKHPLYPILRKIDRAVKNHLDVHLVLDNYAAHKTPEVKAWLAKHKRFHCHFTPTSASWLNLVERFFAEITVFDNAIRDGIRIAAEVLAGRDELIAEGGSPNDIRLLVSSSSGDVTDPDLMVSAASYLSNSPGISMQDLGGLQAVNERFPATVFPPSTERTLGGLRSPIEQTRRELAATQPAT